MKTPVVDTRKRILDAARELYLERGHHGVTMRAVAQRVGVTATALYRHFDDKDALLREVVGEGFRVFASYLYQAMDGRDPSDRLRLSGEGYLRFALEQPAFYRTIFMADRPGHVAPKEDELPHAHATFRFLVDRVTECIGCGMLRDSDPEDVARTIWAHTHGLVSLFIVGAIEGSDAEFRALFGRSMSHLFEGILA